MKSSVLCKELGPVGPVFRGWEITSLIPSYLAASPVVYCRVLPGDEKNNTAGIARRSIPPVMYFLARKENPHRMRALDWSGSVFFWDCPEKLDQSVVSMRDGDVVVFSYLIKDSIPVGGSIIF